MRINVNVSIYRTYEGSVVERTVIEIHTSGLNYIKGIPR